MRPRTCSRTCSSRERYDLSAVGRMKFNRRVGRKEVTGTGVLRRQVLLDPQDDEGKRLMYGSTANRR
jgi:DNA-directed RNA polymerase subunit beta